MNDPLYQQEVVQARPLRVLIVKLSSLGDVIHTLPVVQDLLGWRPDTQVDWVVESGFADLVARASGVQRVIPCQLRQWTKQPFSKATRAAWWAFKADLRQVRYDLVLDLQGLSKSALVAAVAQVTIAGQRVAMANRTDGSSYEVLTRLLADVAIPLPRHIHAVSRGRELVARSQGFELGALRYGLTPKLQPTASEKPAVMLVHGSSRVDKCWPETHWQSLMTELADAGYESWLVHGNDHEQQASGRLAHGQPMARVLPRMPLGQLMDHMAQCVGVIGVDSGLSHLAVALDLPHVQIYNFDTAWRTGPLPALHQTSVYAAPTPSWAAVWAAWQNCVQHRPAVLRPSPQAAPDSLVSV